MSLLFWKKRRNKVPQTAPLRPQGEPVGQWSWGVISDIPLSVVDEMPDWARALSNQHKPAFVSVAVGTHGWNQNEVTSCVEQLQKKFELLLIKTGDAGQATALLFSEQSND
ncbi:MAG: hypothetical protein EP341_03200 [Sphingomonadales bacterium]|nr:MAG: hypothetical protein EP341_03200 [Sphingomonadales bacterium]